MENMNIKMELGHFSGADEIILTTERAESSYGQPVAVLVGGPNSGAAFGPTDVIPATLNDGLDWLVEPAARTVLCAVRASGGDSNSPILRAFVDLE